MTDNINNDLLDGIYTVAMEPERFRELSQIWESYLSEIDAEIFPELKGDFSKLEQHLDRANSILDMVGKSTHATIIALEEKLEQETKPCFAIDKTEKIIVVNTAAYSLFGIQAGLSLSDLHFTDDSLHKTRGELEQRFETGHSEQPSLLHIRRQDSLNPMIASFSNWRTAGGRELVLLKTTDFTWPDYLTPVITKAFGLTRAEADVVRLMVEGATIQEVAEVRGSQVATVRAQIRTIYTKTSTRNQTEFIRMAVGLTTLQLIERENLLGIVRPSAINMPIAYPHIEHMYHLRLPDGRLVEYAVFGASTGKAVLYFHNELLGNIWPYKLVKYATMQGLKIIVPSRPYYGNSDPYPKDVFHPTQTAHDFAAILDDLNIKKVLLMGQTLGGMFAMAFADLYPERSLGLLTLSPMLPHPNESTEVKMPVMHRFISSVLRRNPVLLEFLGRAGHAYYKRVGPIRFLHHAFGDLECDKPILEDPKALEGLVRGIGFGTRYGHKGYVAGYSDLIYNAQDMLSQLDMPLHVIIGDSDQNTRVLRAQALMNKGIALKIIIAKGGGELLKYSHPQLIVDSICEVFKEI